MSLALRPSMSRDEFLDWEGHLDGRFEFDGFRPVAMTGGSIAHSRIQKRVLSLLDRRLVGKPCEALGPDAGMATVGAAVRYPDVLVACGVINNAAKLVDGVVIVVEIISPNTSRLDRIIKLREYQLVPSIRRYIILEQDSASATIHARTDDGSWRTRVVIDEETILLPEIDAEIALSEIYDGILPPAHDPGVTAPEP